MLIQPPAALPCEPPLGLAVLARRLRQAGLRVALIDANVQGLVHLLASVDPRAARTTAEKRAVAQRGRALSQLRSTRGYASRDRYRAAVGALRRTLGLVSTATARVDLADYEDTALSPLHSADLRQAAARAAASPFAACNRVLAQAVAAHQPRVIGVSVSYLHQVLPAMALCAELRRECRAARLLVGGALLGCWRGRLAAEALQPTIDRLVFGDGTAELLAAAGLPEELGALSELAPDYAGVPWSLYLAPRRIASVATSHGCYWGHCRYCPEARDTGERPVFGMLRGAQLIDLLERVRDETRAELLHLTDNAIPPAHLQHLAQRNWRASWYGFARFHPALAEASLAAQLRRSGCVLLQLGLESGSPRVLEHLRKGIELDQASAVLRALSRQGIAVYLYVMFGVPGETRADAERTLQFVVEHAAHVRYLNVSLLNLPLHSPEEPELRRQPYPGDLSLYAGFQMTGGWERREARLFMERDFARHPRVAAILRRVPPVFGANHAPFFTVDDGD